MQKLVTESGIQCIVLTSVEHLATACANFSIGRVRGGIAVVITHACGKESRVKDVRTLILM